MQTSLCLSLKWKCICHVSIIWSRSIGRKLGYLVVTSISMVMTLILVYLPTILPKSKRKLHLQRHSNNNSISMKKTSSRPSKYRMSKKMTSCSSWTNTKTSKMIRKCGCISSTKATRAVMTNTLSTRSNNNRMNSTTIITIHLIRK